MAKRVVSARWQTKAFRHVLAAKRLLGTSFLSRGHEPVVVGLRANVVVRKMALPHLASHGRFLFHAICVASRVYKREPKALSRKEGMWHREMLKRDRGCFERETERLLEIK